MKLAQGEYVALEKIENLYSSSSIVAQIYVHGDSLQSFLLAVLIPDPIQLAQLATSVWGKKVDEKDTAALEVACKDPKIIAAITNILSKEAKRNALKRYAYEPPRLIRPHWLSYPALRHLSASMSAWMLSQSKMAPWHRLRSSVGKMHMPSTRLNSMDFTP